eukprot:EG_transcript_43531
MDNFPAKSFPSRSWPVLAEILYPHFCSFAEKFVRMVFQGVLKGFKRLQQNAWAGGRAERAHWRRGFPALLAQAPKFFGSLLDPKIDPQKWNPPEGWVQTIGSFGTSAA